MRKVEISTAYHARTPLYYATHNSWADFGAGMARKVIVVDPDPGMWRWNAQAGEYYRCPMGSRYSSYNTKSGYLVAELCDDGEERYRRIATPAQLRGTWDECAAIVERNRETARQRDNARREQEDVVRKRIAEIRVDYGLAIHAYDLSDGLVTVRVEDLLKALDGSVD